MIYWFSSNSNSYVKKEAINFFNKYNIEYKKYNIDDLTYNDLIDIINMDETVEPYKILNRFSANRKYIYNNNKEYFNFLLKKKQLVTNIIVDPEKKKVCYGVNENIRKFIPRSYRKAELNKMLNKLHEWDDEENEKYNK